MLIIVSSFLFSISDVASKAALYSISPASVLFWTRSISLPIALLFFYFWRKKINFHSLKTTALSLSTGISSEIGAYLYNSACSLMFVSVVTAVGIIQAPFVFLMATGITLLKPEWIKEDLNKRTLAIKIAAIALLGLGVWLVVN